MILNLDKNFSPFDGKEIEFESFTFSGGEPHIKINPNFDTKEAVRISHRINSFNDLGLLLISVDALRRMGVKKIEAFIPYFPAARQDRLMIVGEPLTVKVYTDIVNSLKLDKVYVYDPHSEVTPALLNNVEVITNYQYIKQVIADIGEDVILISPDGGALKKIYKVSEYLGGIDVIECSKSRDVKTGKITGFKVYADDLENKPCLIVDDICDGGATFIGLAAELKTKNAGDIYLAVSHGIFSKGIAELKKEFKEIYSTDSVKELEGVKVMKIKI
jgi:ribose-phosphate pyrophosphokinase